MHNPQSWLDSVDPDLRELLPDFLRNLAMESARLPGLLAAGDFSEMARVAHSYKGTAGYFSATPLLTLARALELAARNCAREEAAQVIEQWQALSQSMNADLSSR